MSHSNQSFTVKFFRPPQRTVSCNNGLLDTRTKHTVAKDRLIVAEQRALNVERQKSASQLQLISFEQKQLEKKLSSFQNLEKCHRSISEVNLQYLHQTKLNQSLLSLSKFEHFSEGDASDSSEDDESKAIKKKTLQPPPIVAIIPPADDDF